MARLTDADIEEIKKAWGARLTRASFGGGKGLCQMTGGRDGFVALHLCRDRAQLEDDFKAGKAFVFSVAGYRKLKAQMDALYPPPPPRPKRPKREAGALPAPIRPNAAPETQS